MSTPKHTIPKHWQVKKLGEVCNIISGKNQSKVINPNGKYPIYGSSGVFGYANEYLCEAGTTVVGRKGTINNPLFINEKFWNVDTAFGLTPLKDLQPKYLYYFCKGFNFHNLDKSTTIPSLAKTDLLAIDFPYAPLPEQHLIVSKIEELFSELDKGIESMNTALAQLKTYRQAVLKWAFEGKFTNEKVKEGELPKGWKKLSLVDICEKITDGSHFSPKSVEVGYPYVTVKDIKNDIIDFANCLKINKSDFEKLVKNDCRPKINDVLFSKDGTVGKVSIVDFDFDFVILSSIAILRPKMEMVFPTYLFYCLKSDDLLKQALDQKKGVAIRRIILRDLKMLTINLPSIDEQQQIVQEIESRLSVADKLEETITQSLTQAEALKQSILKQAFEGRLV